MQGIQHIKGKKKVIKNISALINVHTWEAPRVQDFSIFWKEEGRLKWERVFFKDEYWNKIIEGHSLSGGE